MIRLGASLVQLYTALVYEGPGVAQADHATGCASSSPATAWAASADAVGVDAS